MKTPWIHKKGREGVEEERKKSYWKRERSLKLWKDEIVVWGLFSWLNFAFALLFLLCRKVILFSLSFCENKKKQSHSRLEKFISNENGKGLKKKESRNDESEMFKNLKKGFAISVNFMEKCLLSKTFPLTTSNLHFHLLSSFQRGENFNQH